MPAKNDPDAAAQRAWPHPAHGEPDDERDTTVVRPVTTFMNTVVMGEATEVVPRPARSTGSGTASGGGGGGDEDRDATIIRATLQLAREAERTLSRGAPLRPLPKRSLALPKGLMMHEYRIERMLGQGGFGITYLATDLNLDSQVAIKEYLPEEIAFRASDRSVSPNASQHRDRYRQGLENFLVEARTLASFRHPNIVRVARFFEAHDTAYMVLEYERGRSLKKWWLAQREQGERLLMERLQPLLEGLAVVHSAGYLHRDIKPDNIQVRSEDGRFVLLDFGSAGQTVALADQDAVVVTPGYAPIEQYGAGEQGAWTDLYALGATLYWVVAGKKPPDAESRAGGSTMPPAAEAGRGRFGPSFLDAIDWALRMDPAERPRHVDEWRDRLMADHVARLGAALPARRDDSVFGGGVAPVMSRAERLRRTLRRAFVPAAWPLATKLSAQALAGAVLMSALLVGAFHLSGAREALQHSQLHKVELLARGAAARVGQAISSNVRLARGVAGDAELARWLTQPDEGRQEALRQRLAALVQAHPELQSAAVADSLWRTRVSTSASLDVQTRTLAAHTHTLAAGQGVVSGAAGSAVLVAEPVRDSGGIVIGGVVLRLASEALGALVDDAGRSAALSALLIDGDGVLLHHPRPELRERRLDDPQLAAAMGGNNDSGHLTWHATASGADEYAGYAHVPGSRWVVALSGPRAQFDAPLQRLALYLWLAAMLAALLSVWAALRMARGIVKPLARLTAGAHALRALDFERAQVDVKRRDELGWLARAFNGTVDVLRQRERERERTASRR